MSRNFTLISHLCFFILHLPRLSLGIGEFLEWGDKCEIPKQGGGESYALTEECDSGKGLVCTGTACECTYKQRYSYDPVANECRRRVGKPCQYVDLQTEMGRETLARLPFNTKCHTNAHCAQLKIPVRNHHKKKVGVGGERLPVEVEVETVSMCVCKEGFVPSSDFITCIVPPPQYPIADMFQEPKTKLAFRPPYYTS